MATKALPKRRVKAHEHVLNREAQVDRDAAQRMGAVSVLQRLLDLDKVQRDSREGLDKECFLLSTEQRHALHVAIGTLRRQP